MNSVLDNYLIFLNENNLGDASKQVVFSVPKKVSSLFKKIPKSVTYSAMAAFVLWVSYNIYKENFDKVSRVCSIYDGEKKKQCVIQYKIIQLKKRVVFLKNSLSKANQTNNPEKYKQKINNQILNLKNKIEMLEKQL